MNSYLGPRFHLVGLASLLVTSLLMGCHTDVVTGKGADQQEDFLRRSLTVTAQASPNQVKARGSVLVTLVLKSGSNSDVNVQLNVQDPSGQQAYSSSWSNVALGGGSPVTLQDEVQVESTDPTGAYSVGVQIKSPSGSALFSNASATSFIVAGGCIPSACAAQGIRCGSGSDGCGGTLNCGACMVDNASVACGSANEGETLSLSCPAGQVVSGLSFASYGTPGGSCGAFSPGSCDASNSSEVVSARCLGRASCEVPAINATFGDPCLNTLKRLFVQVGCRPAGGTTGGAVTSFTPAVIPLSTATDIPNPARGVQIYDALLDYLPPQWPYTDSYSRSGPFVWSSLESTEGHYYFGEIDQRLADAQAHGGRFGFRIISATTDAGGLSGPFVPRYLWDRMPNKYTYAPGPGRGTYYMPDFNDPTFMARAVALIQALGARYANDPRMGWIEPGIMGIDAEWHVADAPHWERTNAGANQAWSVQNGQKIIDAWHEAFPNTRIILTPNDFPVFDYGLSLDSRIGWRHDCMGDQTLDGALHINPGYVGHTDRWKTAPIFWEVCSANPQLEHDQTIYYHFAAGHTVGEASWSQLTSTGQALLRERFQLAGYRFQLNKLTLPSSLTAGQAFTASWSWSNLGLTPAYAPWSVELQLRNSSTGEVVWRGISSLDFQKLLPTTQWSSWAGSTWNGTSWDGEFSPSRAADMPLTLSDAFNLPGNLITGTFDLALVIADPTQYSAPLNLANEGRQPDGSYLLGKIAVR